MGPEFTLKQLLYFVTAAKTGSLSAAAERLYVSQPALSSAITELERSLGVQLSVRQRSRGLTLTLNGQAFYEKAAKLVRYADELVWSTRSIEGRLQGPLTFASYVSLSPMIVPYCLIQFPELEPDISLHYREGGSQEIERMLFEGDVNAGILYDYDLDPRLRRTKLFAREPKVLLPNDSPLANRKYVHLKDLEDEPFIQIETSPAKNHTAAIFADASIVPYIRYTASTAALAHEMVSQGLGWTILLSSPKSIETYRGQGLVTKPFVPKPSDIDIVIAWSSISEIDDRTRAFIDFVTTSITSEKLFTGEHPNNSVLPPDSSW